MRRVCYAVALLVTWSPAVSMAEGSCGGIERPPFCSLDSNGYLTIEADGSAELMSSDMHEDAVQEALLTAKSQLAKAFNAVQCKRSGCRGVTSKPARCPINAKTKKKSTSAKLSEMSWKSLCESKQEIVVRATVTIRIDE